MHARVYGLDLSKDIARAEIFLAGIKKNRVQTDGGRTLVAYSIDDKCLLKATAQKMTFHNKPIFNGKLQRTCAK